MSNGSEVVETLVGETLADVTYLPACETAEGADQSTVEDHAAESPSVEYGNMGFGRVLLKTIKSIRLGGS